MAHLHQLPARGSKHRPIVHQMHNADHENVRPFVPSRARRESAVGRGTDVGVPAEERRDVHCQDAEPEEEEENSYGPVVVVHRADAEEEEQERGWAGEEVERLEKP